MLVHRAYDTPQACKRIFEALLAQGVFAAPDDILKLIYADPSRFFSKDCRLVLHYDPAQRVDGVLFAARGYFIASGVADRYRDTHYGAIQIFVHEQSRRQGIARSLVSRLLEVHSARYTLLDRVLPYVAKEQHRLITPVSAPYLMSSLSPAEDRYFTGVMLQVRQAVHAE